MGHPVDVHVGSRVRQRRWILGITQQALAEELGVTFQQVQKYEMGVNRISASRLWAIARLLGVPVEFFFEGLVPERRAGQTPPGGRGELAISGTSAAADEGSAAAPAPQPVRQGVHAAMELDRDAVTLLRSFCAIPAAQRRQLLNLARALSDPST